MPASPGLVVDACCDLPAEFIQRYDIRVLPIYLRFGGEVFIDDRDPAPTAEFCRSGVLEQGVDAESVPVSVREVSETLEQLALQFDQIAIITISASRSAVHRNICEAVRATAPRIGDLRQEAGRDRPFDVRVIDSTNLFTGQGVLAYEAVRLLQQTTFDQAVTRLESLKSRIRAFVLPQDLYHLKHRASTKGDTSVSTFDYIVAGLLNVKPIVQGYRGVTSPLDKMMDYARGLKHIFHDAKAAIARGLSINVVVMSYAGDPGEIERQPDYREFVRYANDRGVPTLLSVMSTTSAVNVGPRCFSLAYAE